jgi:hypothetical protein
MFDGEVALRRPRSSHEKARFVPIRTFKGLVRRERFQQAPGTQVHV